MAGNLPRETQELLATEARDINAPLANRLGIWSLKTELEALSLRVLDNDAYRIIKRGLDNQFHKRQAIYAQVTEQTIKHLQENLVTVVNVLPSPESIYTAYKILSASSAPYDTVQSPLRLVVLVEDVPSCYLALGFIHQLWRPVPGKFDDYIALPRENLYRALHR